MSEQTSEQEARNRRVIRARNGNFLVFAFGGMAITSWLSRIPDVKSSLNLTPSQLSLLLLSISVGSLIGLPVSGRIANKYGSMATVRFGATIFYIGLLLAAFGVQFKLPVLMPMVALAILGFGVGIWDVAQNLEGTAIEQALGRAIMPWFHAAWSIGTVVGAVFGAGATAIQMPIAVHISLVTLITSLGLAWGVSGYLPSAKSENEVFESRTTTQKPAWLEPRTLLIGLMVLAAAFAEGTANDWMAVAFIDGHGTSTPLGVIALAVFLVFMTAGRVFGTRALDRFGRLTVLRVLFVSAVVGNLMVVFGNSPIAYLGAAIWGVGASLGFPVGMSAAADDQSRAPMRISVVATLGYLAFLAGPPVLGLLGDSVGVLRALLAVAAISTLAIFSASAAKPLKD